MMAGTVLFLQVPLVKVVRLAIKSDRVVLTLDGAEKFLALKKSMTIPLKDITEISTEKVKPLLLSWKVGTNVPRKFMAGTFWNGRDKRFYYVSDFTKCISLMLKNHDYSRVIIQVDDKEAVARELRLAISKS